MSVCSNCLKLLYHHPHRDPAKFAIPQQPNVMLQHGIAGLAHNRMPNLLLHLQHALSSTLAASTSQRKKKTMYVIQCLFKPYTASHTLLQMDWIGDKLSQLIQEGQKALGREIVVASETQEDEVDDGSGAWQEEYPDRDTLKRSSSRSGSIRRAKRPNNIHTSPYRSGSSSPRTNRFDFQSNASASMPIPGSLKRGLSAESQFSPSVSASFAEDETAWESQELRESMSKARARYLANRS